MPLRTLRARLVAALIVVVTLGMVTLAGVTYAEQRSFLLHRVDDQARAAVGAVSHLADGDAPPAMHDRGGGLPLGTYGEQIDATGRILSSGFLGQDVLDASDLAVPDLPERLAAGDLETVSTSGTEYRVFAQRSPDGGLTVVALPLSDVTESLNRLLLVEGLVLGGVLLLVAGVGWIIVRVGLLPLERIGHTAGRIAAGDLSHRVADTDARSEVGRLGQAFNSMLDGLEEAFRRRAASEQRLRQFLSDASHELRTPLSSIRGYAELHRMGVAREPADVDRAMQRIEQEASRMGVLVEDLLTLARLDEVADAPHAEVDLAALARDAVDDARATAPERDVSLDATDDVLVVGDSHQLRQVLGNLLRNAVVHTPAGTRIDVTVHRTDDRAVLDCRDHGPGLPQGAGQEVFDRFWRAEGGRTRGRAGAGLGLAIVDAIVRAHNGRVSAMNAPDGGAVFRVELPLRAGTPAGHHLDLAVA